MTTNSQDTQTCICCGGTEPEPHLTGLLRCAGCGHVWADMRLSHEELKELYSRNYFEGGEYVDYKLEESALRRNFQRNLDALRKRHPGGGRLWEVGAAYGFFQREAAPHFDAAGCDISEHAALFARNHLGMDVVAGDYLSIQLEVPPDIICMWDTVEHLAEPHRYLEKAASDLRPGGTLALSTGDIGSFMARWRGMHWRLLHPPTHLHYFTTCSMRRLLERLGFGKVEVRHHAFWRSADTVAAKLLAPESGLYRALRRTGVLSFAFPLNTRDLMTVYATRE